MTLRASIQVRVLAAAVTLDPANKNPYARETLVVLDQKVLRVFKGFAEGLTTSDIQTKSFTKRPTETVVLGDVLGKTISLLRGSLDNVSVTDTDTINFIKAAYDQVVASDSFQRSIGKGFSDAVGMNDEADIGDGFEFQFAKAFANVTGVSESKVFALIKSLTDAAEITDAKAFDLERPVADTTGATDAHSYELETSRADAFTVDSFVSLDPHPNKFEFISAEDVFGKEPAKFFYEELTFGEEITVAYGVELFDGFGVNDAVGPGDGVQFLFDRSVANVVFTDDFFAKSPEKNLGDDVTITSGGSLRSQGYCDLTYFAEDYVGATRTF